MPIKTLIPLNFMKSLLFVFPGQVPDAVFLTMLIVAAGISFASMVFAAFAGTRKSYIRTLRIFIQLSPPEPRVTDDYAVMLIENVYVFVL